MAKYKASFEGYSNKKSENNNYQQITPIIGISLDQPYHMDEQFKALLTQACIHFSQIHIKIEDYIHKYTLQFLGVSDEEAEIAAIRMGTEWENNFKSFFDSLEREKHVKIIVEYWKQELEHEKFQETEKTVESFYENNLTFRNKIDRAASRFTENFAGKIESTSDESKYIGMDKAVELSKKYFKKKISTFLIWPYKHPNPVFFYPFEHIATGKEVKKAAELIINGLDIKVNATILRNISLAPIAKKPIQEKQPPKTEQSNKPAKTINLETSRPQIFNMSHSILFPNNNMPPVTNSSDVSIENIPLYKAFSYVTYQTKMGYKFSNAELEAIVRLTIAYEKHLSHINDSIENLNETSSSKPNTNELKKG